MLSKYMKPYYCQQICKHLVDVLDVNMIQVGSTVADVSCQITILNAIQMITTAWPLVKEATIANCLQKAGFLPSFNDVPYVEEEIVPATDKEYVNINADLQCYKIVDQDSAITESVAAKQP